MKIALKRIFFFICLYSVTNLAYCQEVNTTEQFAKRLETIRLEHNLPAVAAMQIKDGVIIAAAAGYRAEGNPSKVTIHDIFHLGSCTKAMTATLIGIYVDKGQLKFDSTLEQLFSDYQIHEDLKPVTVAMLLSHMSGISGHFKGQGFDKLADISPDLVKQRELLTRQMLKSKPEYTPDTKFNYSNNGYIILGHILERLAHISWENIMFSELFEPLNMFNCSFGPPKNQNKQHPTQPWPHELGPKGPIAIFPGNTKLADNPPVLGPAGTVSCSLNDWSKFALLHLHSSEQKLLSNSTMQKLHTVYPGQNYTYGGWGKNYRAWAKGDVLSHDGSNTMNYTIINVAPHVNTILLFATNIAPPDEEAQLIFGKIFKIENN